MVVALPCLLFKQRKKGPHHKERWWARNFFTTKGAESHQKKLFSRFLVVVPAPFAQKKHREELQKKSERMETTNFKKKGSEPLQKMKSLKDNHKRRSENRTTAKKEHLQQESVR